MGQSAQKSGSTNSLFLGRFELQERLGAGGMAEVFLAVSRGEAGFQKQVVIKKILPKYARDREFVARLLQEGRILSLMNHGNIVQVLELGQWQGEYFLVMEYVKGWDLKELEETLSANAERLPLELALQVLGDALRGLAYAHSLKDQDGKGLGVVHRDISPGNVLLSCNGEVKLGDFGIAKSRGDEDYRTDAGHLRGKLPYISPEQLEGGEPDCRSDIFSFGVLAFELLSGRRPFDGDTLPGTIDNIRSGKHEPIGRLSPELPHALVELVEACIAKDPAGRPADSAALLERFEAMVTAGGFQHSQSGLARFLEKKMPPPGRGRDSRAGQTQSIEYRTRRRWPVVVALALAVIGLLTVAGALAFRASRRVSQEDAPVMISQPAANVKASQPRVSRPAITPAPGRREPQPEVKAVPALQKPEPVPVLQVASAKVDPPAAPVAAAVEPAAEAAGMRGGPEVAEVPDVQADEPKNGPGAEAQTGGQAASVTKISVLPEGAQILRDGKPAGTGEAMVRLESGALARIELTMSGFETQSFELGYPGPRKIFKKLKAVPSGRLKIRYLPAGGRLLVDGQEVPIKDSRLNIVDVDVPAGAHVVRLEVPGKPPAEKVVEVEEGGESGMTISVE